MVGNSSGMLRPFWGDLGMRRAAVGVCGAAGIGLVCYRRSRGAHKGVHRSTTSLEKRTVAVNPMTQVVSDLVCGALGYLTQMVLLYPVDTLKIKCQAESVNCKEGLRRLFVSNNLGSLFAGIGTAAFCSCLVGAVYFCTYAAAKRVAKNMIFDPNDPQRSHGTLGIEVFASLCSWAATALVDAPVEMLRHQTQAGMLKDGMLNGMMTCLKRGGMMSFYCCLIPYMIKSLPFDVAELVTHGQLNEVRKSSKFSIQCIPEPAWDLIVGGAAGTAAVLSSMPLDCIKTRMEMEVLQQTQQRGFVSCGLHMLRNEGISSLWRGVIPRLVLYVPGVAVYWLAIDTFQRAIEV